MNAGGAQGLTYRSRLFILFPEAGKNRAAKSSNISAGGCLLITEEELPADSLIDLEILLGDSGGESLKIRGHIVRASESSTGR